MDCEGILEESDPVSLHAPPVPEMRHLFQRDTCRKMEPEALLANPARGSLVDEEALALVLAKGLFGGAAPGVLSHEPPHADLSLPGHSDANSAPHAAFSPVESPADLQSKASQEVACVLQGEKLCHAVHFEVLVSTRADDRCDGRHSQNDRPTLEEGQVVCEPVELSERVSGLQFRSRSIISHCTTAERQIDILLTKDDKS